MAYGNLLTTSASGVTTTMSYDVRGRKTGMVDPDMGTWSYHYNAFGELVSQTDAKNQTTTMSYDALGRLVSRTEPEGTTTWTYDTAAHGVGKLASVAAPGGYSESYTYDTLGRPATVTRTIDGTAYPITQQYDGVGRPEKTVYPTGFQTKNTYNAFGALDEVRRADGTHTDLYWQADHYAVDGRIDGETYGNGLTNDRVYSKSTGRLLVAAVGLAPTNGVQYLNYGYDAVGNVLSREDGPSGRSETFVYDALDRLTSSTVAGAGNPGTIDVSYYANGNIHTKSDVGTYAYSGINAGPHAVTGVSGGPLGAQTYGYDANGNMTSGGGRVITWTSFNQAKTIAGAGGHHSEFFFGSAHERVKQVSDTATTIYVGGIFEKVTGTGGTEEKNYIMTPTGRVAVATFGTAVPPTGTVQYFHTDGLGSITAVTDENGAVVKRFAYDAWGKQIDPASGSAITSATNGHVTRGYTDHEMLDDLGLVHMNGRVYDPALGRFLSADPYVGDVGDSQDYNRYSYVGNNPLGFTDPSGNLKLWKDILQPIVSVVVAYYGGILVNVAYGAANGGWKGAVQQTAAWAGGAYGGYYGGANGAYVGISSSSSFSGSLLNGGSIGDAFKSGVISGAQAYFAGKIGDKFGDVGTWQNEVERAFAHGILGGAVEEAQGGQFRHGFYAGAVGSLASSAVGSTALGKIDGPEGVALRTSIAAVAGGTASVLGGGKFANGATTAAFQHLFNFEAHRPGAWNSVKRFFGAGRDGGFLGTSLTPGEFFSDAGTGVSQGAAVWFDRVIPGYDPFADYFHSYDPLDPTLQAAQFAGVMGQDALFGMATAGAGKLAGYGIEVWGYKGAGGGGLNFLRYLQGGKTQSIIRFDLHRLGKIPNQVWRPHVDIPSMGVKHWPWRL